MQQQQQRRAEQKHDHKTTLHGNADHGNADPCGSDEMIQPRSAHCLEVDTVRPAVMITNILCTHMNIPTVPLAAGASANWCTCRRRRVHMSGSRTSASQLRQIRCSLQWCMRRTERTSTCRATAFLDLLRAHN